MAAMTYTREIEQKALTLRGQIIGMQALATDTGSNPEVATRPYFDMLQSLYVADLPLARLLDDSDIVMHAEGPGVRNARPSLAAVNWLTGTAQRSLRSLSAGLFEMLQRDVAAFQRMLDLRLTGIAAGSLYAGFAVAAPPADLLPSDDEPVIAAVRDAVHALPRISACINDESISPDVRDVAPDPAQRDNAFTALLELAPTGRQGIHTLTIAAPDAPRASLSQRERVVLRDAVERPRLANRKRGTFTGELLEIDLSKRRFHIRNVPTVGSLRCVTPAALDRSDAKELLGEQVRVSGEYETDHSGRPRLMIVTEVIPVPAPTQIELSAPRT